MDASIGAPPLASFDPVGLLSLAYWYGVHSVHARVFGEMLRAIATHAG